MFSPRNNDWPTSLGSGSKAYDTALVMQWLEAYTLTKEPLIRLIGCIPDMKSFKLGPSWF